MSDELAQSLAVATHLTMWLAGSRDDLAALPEFADLVAFDSVVGAEAWAERLAEEKADRLWLDVPVPGVAEPVSAGFVGGLPVGLLSTGPAGTRRWRGQWSNASRVSDGAQILVVNYLPEPAAAEPVRVDKVSAGEALDGALRGATRFAERQSLTTWAEVFAGARRDTPPDVGRPDLFPASWPDPDGPRLAGTALAAWVFGGMGSWNDLGFADGEAQREYERISRDLLDAVLRACVAAVNIDVA